MSRFKYILVAAAMGLVGATSAQAEDGICMLTAIAFDDALNPLPAVGEVTGTARSSSPARMCAADKLAGTAAQFACEKNEDARFVAIFRRIDGVDLVDSQDSRTKLRRAPDRDTATIRMKSCAYWLGQDR